MSVQHVKLNVGIDRGNLAQCLRYVPRSQQLPGNQQVRRDIFSSKRAVEHLSELEIALACDAHHEELHAGHYGGEGEEEKEEFREQRAGSDHEPSPTGVNL